MDWVGMRVLLASAVTPTISMGLFVHGARIGSSVLALSTEPASPQVVARHNRQSYSCSCSCSSQVAEAVQAAPRRPATSTSTARARARARAQGRFAEHEAQPADLHGWSRAPRRALRTIALRDGRRSRRQEIDALAADGLDGGDAWIDELVT